jgi:hypothetical protein
MFSEKVQDAILIGVLLPWVVELGKKLAQHFTKKADKKVAEVLGINESGKGLGDEVGFTDAVNQLNNSEKKIVRDFEAYFCASTVERGQDKLIAFRVFVATGVQEKGTPWGKNFLRELLLNVTSEEKLKFLQNRGAFSTVKPEKEPSVVAEKITDYVMHFPEKASKYLVKNQEEVLWALNDANCQLKKISGGPYKGFRKTTLFKSRKAVWASRIFVGAVVSLIILGIISS